MKDIFIQNVFHGDSSICNINDTGSGRRYFEVKTTWFQSMELVSKLDSPIVGPFERSTAVAQISRCGTPGNPILEFNGFRQDIKYG